MNVARLRRGHIGRKKRCGGNEVKERGFFLVAMGRRLGF